MTGRDDRDPAAGIDATAPNPARTDDALVGGKPPASSRSGLGGAASFRGAARLRALDQLAGDQLADDQRAGDQQGER